MSWLGVGAKSAPRPKGTKAQVNPVGANQNLIAINATVSGHVQGVGFRYRTMWAAQDQNLAGWVRNEPDGTVMFHVEGPDYRVEQFMKTIRAGFPGAHISRLETSRAHPEGLSNFAVVY